MDCIINCKYTVCRINDVYTVDSGAKKDEEKTEWDEKIIYNA